MQTGGRNEERLSLNPADRASWVSGMRRKNVLDLHACLWVLSFVTATIVLVSRGKQECVHAHVCVHGHVLILSLLHLYN